MDLLASTAASEATDIRLGLGDHVLDQLGLVVHAGGGGRPRGADGAAQAGAGLPLAGPANTMINFERFFWTLLRMSWAQSECFHESFYAIVLELLSHLNLWALSCRAEACQ